MSNWYTNTFQLANWDCSGNTITLSFSKNVNIKVLSVDIPNWLGETHGHILTQIPFDVEDQNGHVSIIIPQAVECSLLDIKMLTEVCRITPNNTEIHTNHLALTNGFYRLHFLPLHAKHSIQVELKITTSQSFRKKSSIPPKSDHHQSRIPRRQTVPQKRTGIRLGKKVQKKWDLSLYNSRLQCFYSIYVFQFSIAKQCHCEVIQVVELSTGQQYTSVRDIVQIAHLQLFLESGQLTFRIGNFSSLVFTHVEEKRKVLLSVPPYETLYIHQTSDGFDFGEYTLDITQRESSKQFRVGMIFTAPNEIK